MNGLKHGLWLFAQVAKCSIVVLAILLALSMSSIVTIAAEIARFEPLAPPAISADSAYVTDITSGTELFALNPDDPLPPASLTKIAAVLVILDDVNLDDQVEIVKDDLVPAEESQVGLVAGDQLGVRDLLVGMLVPSGNDATLALARHIGEQRLGGTPSPAEAVAEFVAMMNDKAKELGATSSHFVNPTGIDAPGHVMTARDIAVLTKAALQNPLFAEIVSTTKSVLHSEVLPDGYPVTTTNTLLLEGLVTGIKTGTTPEAGGCLVTSFAVGPNEIVSVVLGSDLSETPDGQQDSSARFADTRALLQAAATDYTWIDLSTPDVIADLSEELRVWDVALGSTGLLPVPAESIASVRYRLILGPPSTPEGTAGEVQFFVGDRLLSERPAVQAS